MKKLWTFILILILVSICMLAPKSESETKQDGIVEYYLSSILKIDISGVDVIKNGDGCIIKASSALESVIEDNIDGYNGKTYIFESDKYSMEKFIKEYNVKIDLSQSSQDNVLGFSSKIDDAILIGGKKINVQIVNKNNKIYIGMPILLGSY